MHDLDVNREIDRLLRAERVQPAELLALDGAAHGETAGETARRLHKSRHTIEFQWRTARRRLRARTTTQAVAQAYERGLLPLEHGRAPRA